MSDFGTATSQDGLAVVRFERRYEASVDELWAALTTEAQLGRWLGAEVTIQPSVGDSVLVRWPGGERMNGSILRFDPPRLLEYSWNETQDDPESVVTFEVSAAGAGAILVLEHRRIGPRGVVGFSAGWHSHLDALGAMLAGQSFDLDASYQRLQPEYQARLAVLPAVTADELVRQACPDIGYLGGLFYFAPETLERAAELGLNSSQFYFIGRAGVLGDVSAAVADSALGYFAPSVVSRHWEAGSKVLPPSEIAAAYLGCCLEFGRLHLAQEEWLRPFCAAAEPVLRAASSVALPLFAAVKAFPLAEDLPARAMQLVTALREFRGGTHLLAIVATGLEPRVAHWLTRPDAWANFGYRDSDIPEVTEQDRDWLRLADELTDSLMTPAFSVLDEAGAGALLAGLAAMKAKLPLPDFPG